MRVLIHGSHSREDQTESSGVRVDLQGKQLYNGLATNCSSWTMPAQGPNAYLVW